MNEREEMRVEAAAEVLSSVLGDRMPKIAWVNWRALARATLEAADKPDTLGDAP